ncbi:FAD-binding protein, partial [Pseudoxanthomonas sp. SGD-10]
MKKEVEIVILPDDIHSPDKIFSEILKQSNTKQEDLKHYAIRKRSIDARGKQAVYRLKVVLYINEVPTTEILPINYSSVKDKTPVVVVG